MHHCSYLENLLADIKSESNLESMGYKVIIELIN